MTLVTQSVEAVIRRSACFVLGTEKRMEATGAHPVLGTDALQRYLAVREAGGTAFAGRRLIDRKVGRTGKGQNR